MSLIISGKKVWESKKLQGTFPGTLTEASNDRCDPSQSFFFNSLKGKNHKKFQGFCKTEPYRATHHTKPI